MFYCNTNISFWLLIPTLLPLRERASDRTSRNEEFGSGQTEGGHNQSDRKNNSENNIAIIRS